MSSSRLAKGFTRLELIVTIAVIAVLASLAVPYLTGVLVRKQMTACMCSARQIHLTTMVMANDGLSDKNPELGWPGDLKASGHIANLSDFVNVLVRNDYLKIGDLKVFSLIGYKAYTGKLSSGSNGVLDPPFTEENCAFKVYLVKDADNSNTVFLTTKNFTYNTPLNYSTVTPFGDKGFMVCRKGGDAAILKKQQAQSLNFIGQLPGGGTVESAENCLNPGPATK